MLRIIICSFLAIVFLGCRILRPNPFKSRS